MVEHIFTRIWIIMKIKNIYATILITGILSAPLSAHAITETTSSSGLKHPGCLQNAAQLNALAARQAENSLYFNKMWIDLIGDPSDTQNTGDAKSRFSGNGWKLSSFNVKGQDFTTPAKWAGLALGRYVNDWILNGNTDSEGAAIAILNHWGSVSSYAPNTSVSETQALYRLLMGINLGYIAHAADMLIHSGSSWSVTDQNKFKNTLRNIWIPYMTADRPVNLNGNFDLAVGWTLMAMAVCLDDKALFDEQVAWTRNGMTNGSLQHYFLPSGQTQESARDQLHAQMGLYFAALAAQIAWNQGIDLFEYNGRSIGRAYEYNAAFYLGRRDLPFQVFPSEMGSNSEHDYNITIATAVAGFLNIYEMVYNHYTQYRGVEMPFVKEVLENHTREEAGGSNNNNYSTLFYYDLDLSADATQRQAPQADVGVNFNDRYYDGNKPGHAIYRINCGNDNQGQLVETSDGRLFNRFRPRFYTNGYSATHNENVTGALHADLYKNYYYCDSSNSSKFRLPATNGEYRVRMHFAEPVYTSQGQRIFNVKCEGWNKIQNLDIFSEAGGKNRALVKEFTQYISDGTIDIEIERPGLVFALEVEPTGTDGPMMQWLDIPEIGIVNQATPLEAHAIDGSGDALTISWAKVSGPGTISFSPSSGKTTSATFSKTGDYTIRVTLDDQNGNTLQRSKTITIKKPSLPAVTGASRSVELNYWWGVSSISDLLQRGDYPGAEHSTALLDVLEYPSQNTDNYCTQIRGYIIAPVTDTYLFDISSDDQSQFWLSTDESPLNKQLIAEITSYANPGNYVNGLQTVPMIAGQKYYFETYHHQGTGGDHFSVRWEVSGYEREPISADYIVAGNIAPTIATLDTPTTVYMGGIDWAETEAFDVDGDSLTYSWTQQAGPGIVSFGSADQPMTTVSYSQNGTYTLRITVSDGKDTSYKDIQVVAETLSSSGNGTLPMANAAYIKSDSKSSFLSTSGSLSLKEGGSNYRRYVLVRIDTSSLIGKVVNTAELTVNVKNASGNTVNLVLYGVTDAMTFQNWNGGSSGNTSWNSVRDNGLIPTIDDTITPNPGKLIYVGSSSIPNGTDGDISVGGSALSKLLQSDRDGMLTLVLVQPSGDNLDLRTPLNATLTYAGGAVTIPGIPAAISGCELWLDGDDLDGDGTAEGLSEAGLSGNSVDAWIDKSGANNNATATSQKAILASNALNGRAAIRFNGADNTSLKFSPINNIRTVFLVLKDTDPNMSSNSRFYLGHDSLYDFHRESIRLLHGSHSAQELRNGSVWIDDTIIDPLNTNLPYNQFCQLTFQSTGNVNAQKVSGDRGIGGRCWLGDIAEVIIYNRVLSASEMTTINNYLQNKWWGTASSSGFSSWASTHGLSGSPTADQDGDGVADFVEYAFDTNPTVKDASSTNLPVLSPSGSNLVYDYSQLRNGLSATVMTSTDLSNWTSSPVNGITVSGSTVTINPAIAGNKRFIKLKITE